MARLAPAKTIEFPKIRPENHRITSEEDGYYNCVSWALGPEFNEVRYDPGDPMARWPSCLPRDNRLETFVRFYVELNGYQICDSQAYEPGFVKLALYAKAGEFKHVARQLESGKWTSKLGDWEDIEHDAVEVVEGPLYGKIAQILKRAIK